MEKSLLLFVIAKVILMIGCTKDTSPVTGQVAGIVKGRITNEMGIGIANATVLIEHTTFAGRHVQAVTDVNGYYTANVQAGNWRASVQLQKNFLDRLYNFELAPDKDETFTGTTGAIRNFTWKLTGRKTHGGGCYGSYVTVYSDPASAIDLSYVQLTLIPNGPLADGSMGTTITRKLSDIGGGQEGINDVPIGMYNVRAKNTATGQDLKIRLRNTGSYENALTSFFDSWFTGMNTYQIAVEVKEQ